MSPTNRGSVPRGGAREPSERNGRCFSSARISESGHGRANEKGERGSHECSASENHPAIALGEREEHFQTRVSGKGQSRTTGQFGAHRSPWNVERSRHQQRRRAFLTNATLFAPETAAGSPPGTLRTTPSGLAHSICGGGGSPGKVLPGTEHDPEVPGMGHRVWQPHFPTHRTEKRWYPANRVRTPPTSDSQCPGNNRVSHLPLFLMKI